MWVVSRTGNVSKMFSVFHSPLGVRFILCCHGVRQGPWIWGDNPSAIRSQVAFSVSKSQFWTWKEANVVSQVSTSKPQGENVAWFQLDQSAVTCYRYRKLHMVTVENQKVKQKYQWGHHLFLGLPQSCIFLWWFFCVSTWGCNYYY
jgi:hypothetical protein